jgi:hypothetical protein
MDPMESITMTTYSITVTDIEEIDVIGYKRATGKW